MHDLKVPTQELAAELERIFAERPSIFRAPGRVNLIGEHTDYNDGFVMPAAIDFYTWVAVAPRKDSKLVAISKQFPEKLEADLHNSARPRAGNWTDYVWGVAMSLSQAGFPTSGASLLIRGEVPIGAGLSSSAALEVATGFALLTSSGRQIDLSQLAAICQRAENDYVGARCGIMDQFIACHGRTDRALLLDCRSLEHKYLPLPPELSLVICNTMVKHSVAGREYNQRRAECEEGVRLLHQWLPDIRALRDVTPQQFADFSDRLPATVRKRCKHVVTEDARVLEAADALTSGNLSRLGELMHASHASMRDDFEISCPELDAMVELALSQPGLVGTRMTGGGFGGCTINLVRHAEVDNFRSALRTGYEKRFGLTPDIYVTSPSAGVYQVL
jgi:galactokinase